MALEKAHVAVVVVRIVPVYLVRDPIRFSVAQNYPIAFGHVLVDDRPKEVHLRIVERRRKLHVGAEQPPSTRKL